MSAKRSWMYDKVGGRPRRAPEFMSGVNEFLDFSFSHPECVADGMIRCPSTKCYFINYESKETVRMCLLRNGNITYEERAIEQFNDLGREPTQVEAYAYTHMTLKDDGTEAWVSEEARQRSEDYQNRLREKKRLPLDAPVDQVQDDGLEIWQETVGGVNRGRLVGRPGERWSKRGGSRDYQAYVDSQESAKKWKKLEKDNKKLYDFITYQNSHIKQLGQIVQALTQKFGMEAPNSTWLRPPPTPPSFTCSRDDGSSFDPNDPSSSHLDESDESDELDIIEKNDGSDSCDSENESI